MKKEIILFFFTTVMVVFLHFFIYKPHFDYGFFTDDVYLLGNFLQLSPDPWLKVNKVWDSMGPHGTSAVYYIGSLYNLFGFDFYKFQLAILIFKIISVITFYLLIRIVFKNKILAVVSTIIFSFHYASAGSLEMITRSQDYLVIAGMNLFLLLYYLIITNKVSGFIWHSVFLIIFLISFNLNAIRAYPYLVVIILIEIFNFLFGRSHTAFKSGIKRIILLLSPFLILLILNPVASTGFLGINSTEIYQRVLNGNLQLLVTPISTLGSLFIYGDFYRIFGVIKWDNLPLYIGDILLGPIIVFTVTTLFLSVLISKKPRQFFFRTLIFTFLGEVILFFLINNYLYIPAELRQSYDPYTYAPPAILGIYILTILYSLFKEWRDNQKDSLILLLSWVGILFACIFIWGTWIFQDFIVIPLGIKGYATIPSLGISASIAAIFYLAFLRLKKIGRFTKLISPLIFFLLIPYFQLSNNLIQEYFKSALKYGLRASDQVRIRDKFWSLVGNLDQNRPYLFYFEMVDPVNIYSNIMLDRFDYWVDLYNPKGYKVISCATQFVNTQKLNDVATIKDRQKGFVYKYGCTGPENYEGTISKDHFYSLDNFYAFRLDNSNIADIKSEIIQNIEFVEK